MEYFCTQGIWKEKPLLEAKISEDLWNFLENPKFSIHRYVDPAFSSIFMASSTVSGNFFPLVSGSK